MFKMSKEIIRDGMRLSSGTTVMYLETDSSTKAIQNVPRFFSETRIDDSETQRIRVRYKATKRDCFVRYYSFADYRFDIGDFFFNIDKSAFWAASKKQVIIDIRLDVDELENLKYVLVMKQFFEEKSLNYCFRFIIDETDKSFYKVCHFLSLDVGIALNLNYRGVNQLTGEYIIVRGRIPCSPKFEIKTFLPGEILPYFQIDQELYQACSTTFYFSNTLLEEIQDCKNLKDVVDKVKDFNMKHSKYDYQVTPTKCVLDALIYIYIGKAKHRKNISDFLYRDNSKSMPWHTDTPVLGALLFTAIVWKTDLQPDDPLYEECIDYALSLEQLIENSVFYSNGGVLTFRMRSAEAEKQNGTIEKCDDNDQFLDISLIDWQKNGNSIVDNFIHNISNRYPDRDRVIAELNSDPEKALSHLFQSQAGSAAEDYFNDPLVQVQHYGLQTVNQLAKKNYALLCVKSGEHFFSNHFESNPSTKKKIVFMPQIKALYGYMGGAYYRIVIPLKKTLPRSIYIGFSKMEYTDFEVHEPNEVSISIPSKMPKTRIEKERIIREITDSIYKQVKWDKKDINTIDASKLVSRLNVEFLIKACLTAISRMEQPARFALLGFKNPAHVKLAARIIALCYNRAGENKAMFKHEMFLCDKECAVEIFIQGSQKTVILRNLSKQRVFGTIDVDLFREIGNAIG